MAKKVENKIVFDATDLDVKLGRGKACQLWTGNQRYRKIIQKHQKQMRCDASKTKRLTLQEDRDIVVNLVLHDLGAKTRFLKPLQSPETGFLVLAEERKLEKIRQALREKSPEEKANRGKRGHGSVEDERRWVEVSLRIGGDKPSSFSDVVLREYKRNKHNTSSRTSPNQGDVREVLGQQLVHPPALLSPVSVVKYPSAADWSIARSPLDLYSRTSATKNDAMFPWPPPAHFPRIDTTPLLNYPNVTTPRQEFKPLTGTQGGSRTILEATRTENGMPQVDIAVPPRVLSSAIACATATPPRLTNNDDCHVPYWNLKRVAAKEKTSITMCAIKSRSKATLLPESPPPQAETNPKGLAVARLAGLRHADRALQIPKHIQSLFDQLQG